MVHAECWKRHRIDYGAALYQFPECSMASCQGEDILPRRLRFKSRCYPVSSVLPLSLNHNPILPSCSAYPLGYSPALRRKACGFNWTVYVTTPHQNIQADAKRLLAAIERLPHTTTTTDSQCRSKTLCHIYKQSRPPSAPAHQLIHFDSRHRLVEAAPSSAVDWRRYY